MTKLEKELLESLEAVVGCQWQASVDYGSRAEWAEAFEKAEALINRIKKAKLCTT